MLMESGNPAEAVLAYESVLKISPNRFNSLYGAGHAAELAGMLGKAEFYYYRLIQNSDLGERSRPVIKQVKSFLARG